MRAEAWPRFPLPSPCLPLLFLPDPTPSSLYALPFALLASGPEPRFPPPRYTRLTCAGSVLAGIPSGKAWKRSKAIAPKSLRSIPPHPPLPSQLHPTTVSLAGNERTPRALLHPCHCFPLGTKRPFLSSIGFRRCCLKNCCRNGSIKNRFLLFCPRREGKKK